MRVLLQRVSRAEVVVDGAATGAIAEGFLVLLGVGEGDTDELAGRMAEKVVNLRVFSDAEGRMNLSLLDRGGAVLLVSQFTLYADCRRGRRPGFTGSAPPAEGERLYGVFRKALEAHGVHVETGVFGAHMDVSLTNDGPVTIWLDSDVCLSRR